MSEQETTTQQEQNTVHPESLQDRVNKAHIAKGYTLLNGGSDNIVMIQGEKDGANSDILMTFDGAKEMVDQLEPETKSKEEKVD